jgi:hypothetical protein
MSRVLSFIPDIDDLYIRKIDDFKDLMDTLTLAGNPYERSGLLQIRSLLTCRCAFYGFDGQVFVCLTENDPPPFVGQNALLVVEECSRIIIETDRIDGFFMNS